MAVGSVSQDALPHAVGVTYLTFLTNMPPEVVLGSFMGSIVFLLGVTNKPKWQWLLFFILAFMTGLLGASLVADIISGILGLLRIKVAVPLGMGALVAASCTINVITWLRDDAAGILRKRFSKGGAA